MDPLRNPHDVGLFVRNERLRQGRTQANLAAEARVSRDWLVRLERGHPRLEFSLVMRVLETLGFGVDPRRLANDTADHTTDDVLAAIVSAPAVATRA